MYDVAIILLNYNTGRQCLEAVAHFEALRKANQAKIYLVVVDNYSSVQDRQDLMVGTAGRRGIELILSPNNRGYSAGNNLGLRRVQELGIPYAIVANTDIEILNPDFADRFIAFAATQLSVGLVGPRIYLPDGGEQSPLPMPSLASSLGIGRPAIAVDGQKVYATTGCLLFGSMSIWGALGYMDETIFLYREEWVLAERHKELGLTWRVTDAVSVVHRHKRKTATVRSILWHKRHERKSTRYVMKKFQQRSWLYLILYDTLLAIKTASMILISTTPARDWLSKSVALPKNDGR